MEYKKSKNPKRIIVEFLANDVIEHNPNEPLPNFRQSQTDLHPNIDSALEALFQNESPDVAIQCLYNHIIYSKTNNQLHYIVAILNSNVLNFILPLAHIGVEYFTLNKTLRILNILSSFNQKLDSSFQNPLFAQNMTNIIEKSVEVPTIRKISLKIINKLLIDENIGGNIFLNFIHFKLPSVILSSNIIEPQTFQKLMEKTKGDYVKVVSNTAKLLGNLALHCKENHLSIFASFFNIIVYYLTNDFSRYDKDESIRLNFLYLLSIMMALDTNRKYAYSLQIPEIVLHKMVYQKEGLFVQYSYEIFYQIATNEGLHPIFQTNSFYNLTMNAIQETSIKDNSVNVISSIFKAIGAIMPYDFKNLWQNDILSQVYDFFTYEEYKYKLEALMLCLRFLECACQDTDFCLNALHSCDFISKMSITVDLSSQNQVNYFTHVMKCLLFGKSDDIRYEILNSQDVFEVYQSLSTNENEELAKSADEMLSLWKNEN